MKRVTKHITISTTKGFKQKLFEWAQKHKTVVWLDSNNYNQKYTNFECVLAIGSESELECSNGNSFQQLKDYQAKTNDYLFGYFSYDLKNEVENLSSSNFDGLNFPELFFFQPKKLFFISKNQVTLKYLKNVQIDIENDLKEIQKFKINKINSTSNNVKINLRIHKDAYFEKLNVLLSHIKRGDIYEANFCQEFYSENTTINPVKIYQNLNSISKPPFATFLKFSENYLLSASPERYLRKESTTVISQPIKGTQKRSNLPKLDKKLKEELKNNPKERAENIMIVDLVRNDLSKIAIKGSVKVEELCEVYSFKQVHQLISTVTSKVLPETNVIDIIKATFPMGSMTGAPKISAMKIIEELEETKRGLYSGAVGYFTPENDFDFNVIIRSILYNSTKKYVSFSVGGAITANSIPENEYQECLIKAKAMKKVLIESIGTN